jgi:hypothetical protein
VESAHAALVVRDDRDAAGEQQRHRDAVVRT